MDIYSILWTAIVEYFICLAIGQENIHLKYHCVVTDLMKLVEKETPQSYKTISATKNKNQIKRLCLQSVKADYFFHSDPDNKKPFRDDTIVEQQITAIKSYFDKNKQIIRDQPRISVSAKFAKVRLHSITCYSVAGEPKETWSLVDINDHDRYYVISKTPKVDYFALVGRLEAAPEHDVKSNNQNVLEVKFVTSLKPPSGYPTNDICIVNQLYHFAACAAAAKMMDLSHKSKFKKYNIYAYDDSIDLCVRNGLIEFKSDAYDGLYEDLVNHELGILPCAVNTKWNKPQFYIFNDQFVKNVLFILISKPNLHPPVFNVAMRIKKVSSMEGAFNHLIHLEDS